MANAFAMRLSEYLTSIDQKPSAFAETIGVPASTITRLLGGKRSPGLDLVIKIQEATGGAVTAQDLHEAADEIKEARINSDQESAA